MHKYLILMILLFSVLGAGELKVINQGCNLRATPMGKKVGVVYPCCPYKIIEEYSSYVKVKVIDSKGTSVKEDQVGWITTSVVDKETLTIKNPGCNFRDAPGKAGKKLGALLPGSAIEIIDDNITWYKIDVFGKVGWVWAQATKPL